MKSSPIVICALLSVAMAIRIHDADEIVVNHALIASDADIGMDGYRDLSDSYSDKEIPMPTMAQTYSLDTRDIIDENGDGVEDNVHKSQGELDPFRKKIFNPTEEIHNSQNGEYPGHVRSGEFPIPKEIVQIKSTESLVQKQAPVANPQVMAQANTEINIDSLADKASPIDLSMFTNDPEYVQLSSQTNSHFQFLIKNIQSPEDLDYL